MWKDISSYWRGKSHETQTFELDAGVLRIVVTRHVHYPGEWVIRLNDSIPIISKHKQLENAKREALEMAHDRLSSALARVDEGIE